MELYGVRRDYLGADKNKKIGWLLVLLFKLLVLAALGLLAAGGSSLQSADAKPSDFTLVKVGIAIMFVSWVMLCAWTVQTMMQAGRRQVDASSLRTGRLVSAILVSVVCLQCEYENANVDMFIAHLGYIGRAPFHRHPNHLYPRRNGHARCEPKPIKRLDCHSDVSRFSA